MVSKKKVNLAEVLKHLDTVCPECQYSIRPSEIVRIDFQRMCCPKCGAIFDASKARGGNGANS